MSLIHECGTEDYIHRFFSPYQIPEGLDDEKKQICIRLFGRKKFLNDWATRIFKERTRAMWLEKLQSNYPLLEKYHELFSLLWGETAFDLKPENIADLITIKEIVYYWPIPIPPQLIQSPMTRQSFFSGIAILTAQMDQLENILREQ